MLKDFYDIETEPIVDLKAFYGKPKMITDKCLVIFSKEISARLLVLSARNIVFSVYGRGSFDDLFEDLCKIIRIRISDAV